MANTPRHYVQILDLITALREPSARETGELAIRDLRNLRKIFADENMVGIGVSKKVKEAREDRRLSICFYVEKKTPRSELQISKLLPPKIVAPNGQTVLTDVKEVGKIRPEINQKKSPGQSGFSIGHKDTSAGTLGAIVRKENELFVLSNSHVLAMSGTAAEGDAILYPGKADGGVLPDDRFATLSSVVQFTHGGAFENRFDAALAKIDPGRIPLLDFSILDVSGVPGVTAPAIGMQVSKRGRTTANTIGEVQDVNFRCVLPYANLQADIEFTEQVLCTYYTDEGDSGAIVVDQGSGKIVGLHFAGSANCSVFSPIQPIMTELGFQFV